MVCSGFLVVSFNSPEKLDCFLEGVKGATRFWGFEKTSNCEAVLGEVKGKRLLVYGDPYVISDKDLDIENVEFSVGNFSYVKVSNNGYAIGSDFFGLSVNYLYEGDGFCVVSNSLECIVELFGRGFCFNDIYADVLRFLSAEMINWSVTDDLVVQGLSRLPLGYEYLIKNGSVSRRLAGINTPIDLKDYSYDRLLSLAFDEIRENIKAIAKTREGQHLDVDLSGGKDSRLVLSVAETIPEIRDKIRIVAKDVPGDLDVALHIVKERGLALKDSCSLGRLVPISFDQVLDKWVAVYGGQYARLGIPSFSTHGKEVETKLSGGCGEAVTRTANVEWLRKGKERDFIENIKAQLCRFSLGSKEITPKLSAHIDGVFSSYAGMDMGDALNKYYLNFRNRIHFGLSEFSRYSGDRLCFPLLSRNLYYASLLLGEDEIYSAKLIYDLMNKVSPEMLNYPFSSRFPCWEKSGRVVGNVTPNAEVRELWKKSNAKWIGSRGLLVERGGDRGARKESCKSDIEILYFKGLDSIYKLGFVSGGKLDVNALLSTYYKSFMISERYGTYFSVYLCGLSYLFGKIEIPEIDKSCEYYKVLPKRPVVEAIIDKRRGGRYLVINIKDAALIGGWKFAYYLYVNEKCVRKVWYTESQELNIDEQGVLEGFSVKVFVKTNLYTTTHDFDFQN